ncbi:restriction endonuclease subunit S [Spiroplasma endosymbiont of Glossina fuscipes fuscipes]|uniref:restriction endonuclease subunit S n=1 Tax=Spiroplasma endosymbiont of Glossina fuscipes fuscipes TaxID=2004463 RepID=UPI003C70FA98
MNKSLVPKIRFKGFNDEWKKYKLNDIGFFFRGLYKKTKADFEINNSNFYYVTYTNIYNNSFIKIDSLKYVNINNNEKQNRLIKGDILFTMTSETYNEVGLCSIFNSDIDNVYLNSFCSGFRIINIKAINSIFLLFLLLSIQYREKIIKMANGFTRYNLSKKLLLNLQVKIPNIIQQNKIADFFTIIDRKIELIKEQLSLLEKQKQYYLNNMFVNEKSYPKIRFKGFNDEWVLKQVQEVLTTIKSLKIKKNFESNTKLPLISQKKDFIDSYIKKGNLVEQLPIILFGDHTTILKYLDKYFFVADDGIKLLELSNSFRNFKLKFIYYSVLLNNVSQSGYKRHFLMLKNVFISLTNNINEQTKIAHFFTIIDRKIELIKEQLNLLEKQKQYYLNNMFI